MTHVTDESSLSPILPANVPVRACHFPKFSPSEAIHLNHIAHYSPGWVSANACVYLQLILPNQLFPKIADQVIDINFTVGDQLFSIKLPSSWVASMLRHKVGEILEPLELSEIVTLAFLEVGYEDISIWLEERLGRPVRLFSMEVLQEDFPFNFLAAWRSDQEDIDFRISCHAGGLPLIIDLLSGMYEVPRETAWVRRLPFNAPIMLGYTRLSYEQIDALQQGDVVMIERGYALWYDSEEDVLECALKIGQGAWRVQFERNSLMCVEWMDYMDTEEYNEEQEHSVVESQEQLSEEPEEGQEGLKIDHVLMPLAFDLGELKLSVEELKQLTPGRVFAIDRPIDQAVFLRVNGMVVGRGQLVEIDGSLGVMIQSLRLE